VIFNEEEGVIHQGTFLLAEEAKTGIYTIRVTGKNSASCSFSVEEYVLPKFGVEIEGLFLCLNLSKQSVQKYNIISCIE